MPRDPREHGELLHGLGKPDVIAPRTHETELRSDDRRRGAPAAAARCAPPGAGARRGARSVPSRRAERVPVGAGTARRRAARRTPAHRAPRVATTRSEVRPPEMEQRIAAAWGVAPFNVYASTETGLIAVDCDRHAGLHVFEDYVLLEAVDADGRPVPDGEPAPPGPADEP